MMDMHVKAVYRLAFQLQPTEKADKNIGPMSCANTVHLF